MAAGDPDQGQVPRLAWAAAHARTVGRSGHTGRGTATHRPAPGPPRITARERLPALTQGVREIIWSVAGTTLPDGTPLLASTHGNGVLVWDPLTGAQLRTLAGNERIARSVAVTTLPDGTPVLASGGYDGAVHLWNPVTGQHRHRSDDHRGPVWPIALATLPDGRPVVASTSNEHRIVLANSHTGQHLGVLGTDDVIYSMAFARLPDGTPLLAAGDNHGDIRLMNPASGEHLATLTGHSGIVYGLAVVALPHDVLLLVSSAEDGTIRLWDPVTGQRLGTLNGHSGTVRSIALTLLPDGTPLVASGGYDNTCRLWTVHDGQCVAVLRHTTEVNTVAFVPLPDGRLMVATGTDDGAVNRWDIEVEYPQPVAEPEPVTPAAIEIVPTGVRFAEPGERVSFVDLTVLDGVPVLAGVTHSDTSVRLWNAETGQHLRALHGAATLNDVVFGTLTDGATVVGAGGQDGTVSLWDAHTGERRHLLQGHTEPVWDVALGRVPGGRSLMASASLDGTVRVWDAGSGAHLHQLIGHRDAVRAVAFGSYHDGRTVLASAGDDRSIRVWDPASGHHLLTIADIGFRPEWVDLVTLPDGGRLLASGGQGQIGVWDPDDGTRFRTLPGQPNNAWGALASARPGDPPLLACRRGGRGVDLWDPASGRHLGGIEEAGAWGALALLPDGTHLLAIGSVGTDGPRTWRIGIPRPRTTAGGRTSPGPRHPLTLAGHTGRVWSLASTVRPDGTPLVASCGADQTIRLWNAATGEPLHSFDLGTWGTPPIALGTFSDGTTLLTGNERDWIKIWDATTGEHWGDLGLHPSVVYSLTLVERPDGEPLLACGDTAGRIHLCDPRSGTHVGDIPAHSQPVYEVAATALPDGTILVASVSADRTVRLWNAATRERLGTFEDRHVVASRVALATARDGTTLLASISTAGTVNLRNALTGEAHHTLTPKPDLQGSTVFAARLADAPVFVSVDRAGQARLWNAVTGAALDEIGDPLGTPFAVTGTGTAVVAGNELLLACAVGRDIRVSRVPLRPSSVPDPAEPGSRPAQEQVRVAARGLVALSQAGLGPPLGLLADLVALTGAGQPYDQTLAPLAGHRGIRRVAALGWPSPARVGLAALLLGDVPFDARFSAPDEPPERLYAALAEALVTPAGPVEPAPVSLGELLAGADRLTEQLVTLLAVLGAEAVAVDPVLPLRMRQYADALPPLPVPARAALAEVAAQVRQRLGARASSVRNTAGTNGISRRGTVPNLLHTQLALPAGLFATRYARGDVLYRLHDGQIEPRVESATIVLDTTPPTFGPVESALRLVAHALVTALWAAGREAVLVSLDNPQRAVPLTRPADLVSLWAARTLDVAALEPALRTADRQPTATTVLLTHHHLARESRLVASAALRVLTTHTPGDPPARAPRNPFHVHLPPRPDPAACARAVAALLAPSPNGTG